MIFIDHRFFRTISLVFFRRKNKVTLGEMKSGRYMKMEEFN